MKYVLGIDQGGTKTHALIADTEGQILGIGCDMGSCHSVDGMDHAMKAVEGSVGKALRMAGISIEEISMTAAGMTGVDWPEEAGLLREALGETLGLEQGKIHVVNDCIIALRAATSSPVGCVLCAGTGLNCAVRDGRGNEFVFGYYIPDEDQGGMALANRVLRAVFDAESGMGAPTSLTTRCLALTGCKTVDELLRRKVEHKISRAQQHQLPIIVEEEALKEDAVSMQILTCFGRDEAAYAVTAIRRMGLQNESVDVILSGSIFKCSAPVLKKAVEETIHSAVPLARIIESVWEPAIGALLLALDDIGTEEQGIIHQHIERDAKRFNMVRNKTKAKER